MLDDAAWTITDVTAQIKAEQAQAKGEDVEQQQAREANAIETLKRKIAERYESGDPVSATEAVEILRDTGAGSPRDRARNVRDKGIGLYWLQTSVSRKGSGSKSCFIPITAAKSERSETITQASTSDQMKLAVILAEGPQTLENQKQLGEKAFSTSESLRTKIEDPDGYGDPRYWKPVLEDGSVLYYRPIIDRSKYWRSRNGSAPLQ